MGINALFGTLDLTCQMEMGRQVFEDKRPESLLDIRAKKVKPQFVNRIVGTSKRLDLTDNRIRIISIGVSVISGLFFTVSV